MKQPSRKLYAAYSIEKWTRTQDFAGCIALFVSWDVTDIVGCSTCIVRYGAGCYQGVRVLGATDIEKVEMDTQEKWQETFQGQHHWMSGLVNW